MKNIFLYLLLCLFLGLGHVELASGQVLIPSSNEILLPQYIATGSAYQSRAPMVTRLKIAGLSASTTYRYFTGASTNNAVTSSTIPGNMYTVNHAGGTYGFVNGYTTSKGMTGSILNGDSVFTSGNKYGEFTTDANGDYEGYFTLLPTGNSVFTSGNDVYFYVFLNDGAGGSSVNTRYRTTNTIKVLSYGSNSNGTNEGSAVYGHSYADPESFVFVYDNQSGTGRPLYGTWTQDDGITTDFNGWFTRLVDTTSGAWGVVIPNDLDSGIRRIESRNVRGGLIISHKDADGVWPSGTNTTDPSADTNALFISNTDAPLTTPIIEFTSSQTSPTEDSTQITIDVELKNPDASASTSVTVRVASGTTAAHDSDYKFVTTTLTWNAGSSGIMSVNVDLLEDAFTEGDENLILELINPTNNAIIGVNSHDTITIIDDEFSTVYFEKTSESHLESGGIIKMAVKVKNPNINVGSSVEVAYYGGTASFGSDFYFASQTVTFPPNSTATQFVDLDVKDDTTKESKETIIMYLMNPSMGQVMENEYDTINVIDDDGVAVRFTSASGNLNEKSGSYSFSVSIAKPDASNPTSVDVEINGGTAGSGDYSYTKQTLTFPAGSSTNQTVNVSITDDTIKEGTETLTFILSNPTNGAVILSPSQFILNIEDDDSVTGLPKIAFASDTSSILEGQQASINLSINQAPASLVKASLSYSGTALAGTHYNTPPATLNFPAGSASNQILNITTKSDNQISGNKTVIITISGAGSLAVVGTPSIHTLTIKENGITGSGSSSLTEDSEIKLWPVPTSSSLFISSKLPVQKIKIFSQQGQLILISNPQNEQVVLDVQHLPSGLYWVEITHAEQTKRTMFIRQ